MKKEPMTQEGYDQLIEEFKFLNTIEKPRVNHEKQVAAEQGDRSENAEYHAAKEKLRHINRRLFYLNDMIEKASIINPEHLNHSKVHFGTTVTLEDLDDDTTHQYTLCGVLESEVEQGLISIHAPLAQAMLGKSEGDTFKISLPQGAKEYEVLAITYINIYSLKKNIRSEKDYTFK